MDHSPSNESDSESENEVLIRLARQHFLQSLCSSIPDLDRLVVKRFEVAGDSNFKDLIPGQSLPIATWFQDYMQHRRTWAQQLLATWRASFINHEADPKKAQTLEETTSIEDLSLISDDAIEGMIASSRISMQVTEKVEPAFAELRKRLLGLDRLGLRAKDPFQSLVVAENLVNTWTAAQLHKSAFMWVMEGITKEWAAILLKAYKTSNDFLEEKGVKPVKPQTSIARETPAAAFASHGAPPHMTPAAGGPMMHGNPGAYPMQQGMPYPPSAVMPVGGGMVGGGMVGGGMVGGGMVGGGMVGGGMVGGGMVGGGVSPAYLAPQMVIPGTAVPMAAAPALIAPAAQFGQPAIQQVHALWNDVRARLVQVIGADPAQQQEGMPLAPSPALAQAMDAQQVYVQQIQQAARASALMQAPAQVSADVAQLAREQSDALKQEAEKPNEKAIIEMVALMFQSVISESRIPASVRVLFARLQVPVLRVALTEPAFFSEESHPVRRLIDRMGSAAMGFDGANFQGSALEVELGRLVQMIEQYPDTGSKVFQLALNEFEKFLQQFLAENRQAGKAMSVAQQVEEKETLLVKFTIELRKMLQDLPIKEELRSFLFKTWAEVLAVSAVRSGAQGPETQKFKQTAALLVWAVGTKADLTERRRVAQALPGMLTRLRTGMSSVGVTDVAQEAILLLIVQSIQEAFLATTEGLPIAKIKQLSARLDGLENLVTGDDVNDIALSPENIEMMTGLELVGLVVIEEPANTGVSPDVLEWAKTRSVGEWFYLIPGGSKNAQPQAEPRTGPRVQYAWHSARRHLHLLLMPDGRSLLMKLKTLAVCFDQGQLVPVDQEGLMLRATRVALTQYQPLSSELANAIEKAEEAQQEAMTQVMPISQTTDFDPQADTRH